jgi:hypothetical protein
MANTAAHLVDRVLPSVPVRQFVLSFPYELSGLAATRPDVLASLCRLLNEAISLHYRSWAKSAGYTGAQTGAVLDFRTISTDAGTRPVGRVVIWSRLGEQFAAWPFSIAN